MMLPCPHCGSILILSGSHYGKPIACPSCGKTLTVPKHAPDAAMEKKKPDKDPPADGK